MFHVARSYAVYANYFLGNFGRLAPLDDEAMAIAQKRGHLPTIVWAYQLPCRLRLYTGNFELLTADAQRLLDLSEEFGFNHRAALAHLYLGYAQLMNTNGTVGLEEVKKGCEMWLRYGGKFHASQHASDVCRILLEVGHTDAAAEFLEFGEQVQEETEERWYKSELLRLRARMTERRSSSSAEVLYREALLVAAHQSAKLFKLRTAIDLGRLLRTEGRSGEATSLLQQVLSEIPEGSSVPEVGTARMLVEEFTT